MQDYHFKVVDLLYKKQLLGFIINSLVLFFAMLICCKTIAAEVNIQTPSFQTLLTQVNKTKDSNLSKALDDLTQIEDQLGTASLNQQIEFYKIKAEIYSNMSKFQLSKDTATIGLNLGKQLSSPIIQLADLLYTRGFALESLGKTTLAAQDYMNGLDIAESLDDKSFIAQGLINLGALYYLKEKYEKALIMLNEALNIANSLQDNELKGYIFGELGNLYALLGQTDKTLEFYRKSYKHYKDAGKNIYAITSLANIASYYLDQGEYDKAIDIEKEIIAMPKEIMTDDFFYSAYSGLAWAYNRKKDKDAEVAYQYILIAGQYITHSEQAGRMFGYIMEKSYILESLKRYDEVLENLFKAEKLLTKQEIEKNSWQYLNLLNLRANIYYKLGRYQTAYQLKSDYINRVLEADKNENIAAIENVRLKFESEQADLKKKILDKQRILQSLKLTKIQSESELQKRYFMIGLVVILLLFLGIYKLIKTQKKLVVSTRTDGLTGVANRHRLAQLGNQYFTAAIKSKQSFCVLMVDVDHFKEVNDNFGHKVGDEVLKDIVLLGQHALRAQDEIGRFGGEEFVVILPNTDLTQGLEIAERLRNVIHQHKWQDFKLPEVTISIGLACFDKKQHKSFDDVLKRADELLYQAKSEGRNKVCA
jgi:diguanylate cyclase (GGDEF)-like protein